jgi:hypothetical protein
MGGAFMRNSSRLVSVVFLQVAVLFGLFAVSTVGRGSPLTVLNWIPPTSPSIATMAPCNFVAPTCDAAAATNTGTIPMWLSTDTGSSLPYTALPIAMVGKDPSKPQTASTSISTKIVPLVFTGSASGVSYVFDPENNDACSPSRNPGLNMVQASPVFKPVKLVLNLGGISVSLGTYQFGSQFQRANFATSTIKTGSNTAPVSPNYDISLSQVLVNADETVKHRIALATATPKPPPQTLPYSIEGQVLPNTQSNSDWCNPLALIEVNDFDALLQSQILPPLKGTSGVLPTTLPIFLLSNVVMYDKNAPGFDPLNPQGVGCCILGYHNAYLSQTTGTTAGKLQTYIVVNYDTTGGTTNSGTVKSKTYPGAFPTAPNIVALANMVAGWIDNPTTLNPTPSWPSSTSSGTGSFLEVAYPQCNLPPATPPPPLGGNLTSIVTPKFTYSVQDLAFKSWFYDLSTNTSVINQYSLFSLFGTLTAANPSLSCPF